MLVTREKKRIFILSQERDNFSTLIDKGSLG